MATTIELDPALQTRVQHLAQRRHQSAKTLVDDAIRDYVQREETIEAFKQEALMSKQSFDATGQHLTGEEVQQWLQTWGTAQEDTIPTCHS